MYFNKKNTKRKKGETILEVMIATVILVVVLVATFMVLNQSVAINADLKNRVIALNIAREGMEGVRNVRDTNWIRYAGDRRNKWLCQDSTGQNCQTFFTNGFYILNTNSSTAPSRYFLTKIQNATKIDISDGISAEEQQGSLYDHGVVINHDAANGTKTPFYRQIELQVENPYDETNASSGNPPLFCNSGSCNTAQLKAIVRVQWPNLNGATEEVMLEAKLFDYYNRNGY